MNTRLIGFAIAGWCGCAASEEPAPSGPGELVDDLEDGDDLIEANGGRLGGWYTFHDDTTTGSQTPPDDGFVPSAGGANDSAYAAQTTGSGFAEWGAGMGFDLNNPAAIGETGDRATYDASGYSALSFQARGNVTVRLAVEVPGTVPTDRGGTCSENCDDLHGVSIALTDEWTEHVIGFDDLRQEGWGTAVDFDATEVTAVLFMVAQDLEFDVAVDDVAFHE
jgi:hypothetical protein